MKLINLIAYVDLDDRIGDFTACPTQMKAATDKVFSLDPKYAKFPGLILAYVWNIADSSKTKCFALTYEEALSVAQEMQWTGTASWLTAEAKANPDIQPPDPQNSFVPCLLPMKWTQTSGGRR
ncbi:MAG TPA: hypothetical protein VFP59_15285 [Candidatus Angelobacter sp.]|nr:hypothetical protein [Candidatus Angelobacter sp.]